MRQLYISQQFTNRKDSRAFDNYLREISKYKHLTSSQEVTLSRRIQQGDEMALSELVTANLAFVVSVAKQFATSDTDLLMDLINEGNIGMIEAAHRFDGSMHNKFISYAVHWVLQYIFSYLSNNGRPIRLPANKVNAINKVNQKAIELEKGLCRQPSDEEIADACGMTVEAVYEVRHTPYIGVYLDKPLREDDSDSSSLHDIIADKQASAPDSAMEVDSLRQELRMVVSKLPKDEAAVITLKYGLDEDGGLLEERTNIEVGQCLGLSDHRVKTLFERGIRRILHTEAYLSKLYKYAC